MIFTFIVTYMSLVLFDTRCWGILHEVVDELEDIRHWLF